jgi:DNA modification methylase
MEKPIEEQTCTFYFKLFNNLKDESEIELAERELTSLFGQVGRVANFVDEFAFGDLSKITGLLTVKNGGQRLQDAITYELPYGRVQGFKGTGRLSLLPKLTSRLAYTREIYALAPAALVDPIIKQFRRNINLFLYENGDLTVIRTIATQFFLEKSAYISKLSRNVAELDANLSKLLNFFSEQPYRIPATETMAVGRRLEDWFAIREEPSLYLTHYMHPYKGKFHPKMARALVNYVFPGERGMVLDNFSGSGTTLVEAQWLGLDSIGVDINPLSSLMSQVKVQCRDLDLNELDAAIDGLLAKLKVAQSDSNLNRSGQSTVLETKASASESESSEFISNLPPAVRRSISTEQIQNVTLAHAVLRSQYGELNGDKIQEFLLLGLSGAVSDISRRTSQPFLEVLEARLRNLWRRMYLMKKLQSALNIRFGEGECLVGDTRNLNELRTLGGGRRKIEDDSVDCIVDSPPYSTALDYIRNDLPQLSILRLVKDGDSLEQDLIGNPNLRIYGSELWQVIREDREPFAGLPPGGKGILKKMVESGREKEAGRVLKFWIDMRETLKEMKRVLKPHGRAAIVIGDNNVQLERGSGTYEQVPNVAVIQELGKTAGLHLVEAIGRDIEKSMSGMIRSEAIVVFEK